MDHCQPSKRDRQADGAATKSQQQTLGQTFPDESPPTGTERDSKRHLRPPRHAAGQRHVGHVGTCDQQHKRDDKRKQRQDQPRILACEPGPYRHNSGIPPRVGGWVGELKTTGDRRDLRTRLFERDTWLNSPW